MEQDAKKWLWWGIPIVVVAGLLAALYYGRKHNEDVALAPQPTQPLAPPAPAPETPANYPIQPAAEARLPALADSDAAMQDSLLGVVGQQLQELLVPKDLIRHIVATIDNLPRKKTTVQLWPLKPIAGQFVAAGEDDSFILSAANFARYDTFMKLVRNTDVKQVAAVYRRFYPLFQQAYSELGYPDGYFNNRLVQVIDHLLETPEITGPIELTQPRVFYEFADPELEERSAGQKLLIRMGSNHATELKLKLRELRREIAKQPGQ